MIISKECLFCTKKFNAVLAEHKRGNAKFCCLKCASRHYRKNQPKPTPNLVCAVCSKQFYRAPSKIYSKSGLQFCNRKCKDKAQRINGGLPPVIPSHYGTTNANTHGSYRLKALRKHPHECADCGYGKYVEVLQVHHDDGNRENNHIKNLVILCPTCHVTRHYLKRTNMVEDTGVEPVAFRLPA